MKPTGMRHYWIATLMFSVGAIVSGVGAWYGQRLSIIVLVVFQIAIAVFLHLQRRLTWELLGHISDGNDLFGQEIEFSKALVGDHLKVLGRLYELDPTAAEVYQDRFREACIKRHPQILEERARTAEMN